MVAAEQSETPAALEALTVVELTDGIAGAFAGKLLAGYGARVIKVEPPGVGDAVRRMGPFPNGVPSREAGALHLYLNTAKLGVTLDCGTPTGASLLRRLLNHADAAIDGDPGRLATARLSVETLRRALPRLVVTGVSPYGSRGPWAGRPATNLTAFAAGGLMSVTGDPDREPLLAGGYQAEYQAGLNAFAATLAACWSAGQTEHGQDVEVAAMEAQVPLMVNEMSNYIYRHSPGGGPPREELFALPRRRGNVHNATIGFFPCADGVLGIHAMERQVPALLRMIGAEDASLARDRLARNDELTAMIYAWAADRPKREACKAGRRFGVPLTYAHDIRDLLESEHLRRRGFFQDVEHPEAGTLSYPRGPFLLSDSPWTTRRAPLLGEHNQEVFGGMLGLAKEDLAVLRAAGVV
jgi:CoA:oxalate CoA-transferase